MKLIVGLGNPGEQYENTRHNAGFAVAEEMAKEGKWRESKKFGGAVCEQGGLMLLKPSTFMNESGRAVRAVVEFYKLKPEDVYVVHDDLDIRLGEYKIQLGKGPHLHYGVESVEKHLRTEQFWRVRIGVESREQAGNKGVPGVKYVLQKLSGEDQKVLERVVVQVVAELVGVLS